MPYTTVDTLTTEEINLACKKSKCFRQANGLLHIHLLDMQSLVDRVIKENIDVSHFNTGNNKCQKCGNDYQVMKILDFDEVGRKYGKCKSCNYGEWVEDGGDIIDAYHYFTEGYKTKQMLVVGHVNI
jgi:hypothetical protein